MHKSGPTTNAAITPVENVPTDGSKDTDALALGDGAVVLVVEPVVAALTVRALADALADAVALDSNDTVTMLDEDAATEHDKLSVDDKLAVCVLVGSPEEVGCAENDAGAVARVRDAEEDEVAETLAHPEDVSDDDGECECEVDVVGESEWLVQPDMDSDAGIVGEAPGDRDFKRDGDTDCVVLVDNEPHALEL